MAQSIEYTACLSTHKTTIKDNDTLQEKLAKKLMFSGGFPPPEIFFIKHLECALPDI